MHSWEVMSGATLRTSAYRLVRVEVGDRAGGRGGWRTRWRIWQGRGRRATSTSPCGLRCGGAAGRGLVMREAVTGRTRATGVLISGRCGARACPRGQAVREQQRDGRRGCAVSAPGGAYRRRPVLAAVASGGREGGENDWWGRTRVFRRERATRAAERARDDGGGIGASSVAAAGHGRGTGDNDSSGRR